MATTRAPRRSAAKPREPAETIAARRARAGLNMERQRLLQLERETLERERIPIGEVRTWAKGLAASINRILARLGNLPDITPAQATWLAEFERAARAEIQGLG